MFSFNKFKNKLISVNITLIFEILNKYIILIFNNIKYTNKILFVF